MFIILTHKLLPMDNAFTKFILNLEQGRANFDKNTMKADQNLRY